MDPKPCVVQMGESADELEEIEMVECKNGNEYEVEYELQLPDDDEIKIIELQRNIEKARLQKFKNRTEQLKKQLTEEETQLIKNTADWIADNRIISREELLQKWTNQLEKSENPCFTLSSTQKSKAAYLHYVLEGKYELLKGLFDSCKGQEDDRFVEYLNLLIWKPEIEELKTEEQGTETLRVEELDFEAQGTEIKPVIEESQIKVQNKESEIRELGIEEIVVEDSGVEKPLTDEQTIEESEVRKPLLEDPAIEKRQTEEQGTEAPLIQRPGIGASGIENPMESRIENQESFKDLIYDDHNLLQEVVWNGMFKSAARLIELGFDINSAPDGTLKPIRIACIRSDYNILELLICHGALNAAEEELNSNSSVNLLRDILKRPLDIDENLALCLQILLGQRNEKSKSLLNVNGIDELRRTPLHYATMYNNKRCVELLLKNGANETLQDNFKQSPLSTMPEDVYEDFFNDMVSLNTTCMRLSKEEEYDLKFNLKPIFEKGNDVYYSDWLRKIKKEKRFKKILGHPIFSIIIYFQWYRIRPFFYFYIVLYVLFCALYTSFIIIDERPGNKTDFDSIVDTVQDTYSSSKPLLILCLIMLLIFTVLEIIKMAGELYKFKFFRKSDNNVRFVAFATTWVVVIYGLCDSESVEVKAFSILFVWLESFLVIARHPAFAYHMTTFRSASVRLLKFILAHSFLLIGFSLSNYILFSKSDIFQNHGKSIFKTIIMITGDYNFPGSLFNNYEGVSHTIFVLYIFVVAIVLFNLMIAISFSKVNKMEQNRSLYKSFTRINTIAHFESYLLKSQNDCQKKLQNLILGLIGCIVKLWFKITCYKEKDFPSEEQSITVRQNKMQQFIIFETYPENKIKFVKIESLHSGSGIFPKIKKWFLKNKLDFSAVNKAHEIAGKRLKEKRK